MTQSVPIDLSPSQIRIWQRTRAARSEMHPSYVIHGQIDVRRFRAAVLGAINLHAPLRTRVVADGDRPRAAVRAPITDDDVPITLVDWTSLDFDKAAERLDILGRDAAATSLDLDHGLPLHITLVRLRATDAVLFLNLSNVVADGWSCGVLVRDLQRLYRESGGHDIVSPAAEYETLWRTATAEETTATPDNESLNWWIRELTGIDHTDPLRPLGQCADEAASTDTAAALLPFSIAASDVESALAFTHGAGRSTYTLLLAATVAALATLTGRTELLITTPNANRLDEDVDKLVGRFASRMALRIPVAPSDTFKTLLDSVWNAILDAHEHSDVTFQDVQSALAENGNSIRAPLSFQVFPRSMTDAPVLDPDDLGIALAGFRETAMEFDLSLNIFEPETHHSDIDGLLAFHPTKLSPARARSLVDLLGTTIATVGRDSDAPVRELMAASSRVGTDSPKYISDPGAAWLRAWTAATAPRRRRIS